MWRSKKILLRTLEDCYCGIRKSKCEIRNPQMGSPLRRRCFSLIETMAALAILALISSSVLVVINRCMASAADSALRMQAFGVVRDNMEKLLVLDSVGEKVEYGSSEKNPDIQWQTTVEAFYEPLTARMWIRAVCEAEYTDMAGEAQTVELTHWLTSLSKKQILNILEQRKKEQAANQTFETIEEAAEYLGVDAATIQQWIDNGMGTMADGSIPRRELDLYEKTDGNPTIPDRIEQAAAERQTTPEPGETVPSPGPGEERYTTDLICGYTIEELLQMPFDQVWQIFLNCDKP